MILLLSQVKVSELEDHEFYLACLLSQAILAVTIARVLLLIVVSSSPEINSRETKIEPDGEYKHITMLQISTNINIC